MRDLVDASTCSPFPPVGTVAAPCGSPAVPHLRRYYGFVRLLAYTFLPPPVSLGGRYSSLRVYSLPWGRPCFPGTWFDSGRANRFARFGRDSELSCVHGKSF